ncbi:MAG: hypothetical protein P4M11_00395 [Candidatus Pacebacteria bacterium]|nr:hypothetical protein [Candidatus Paceibacterota bacterium]
MPIITDIVVIVLVGAALFVTGLFVWGVWHALRTAFGKPATFNFKKNPFTLTRHANNPLLHPGKYDFEKEAVMNPAAIHDGDTTHLFYRAIGNDGVSRIGYASSKDGSTINERLPYPVFALEGPDPHLAALRRQYAEQNHPGLVASGGSWGGTEDPRAVIIDDRAYLSFSAFHSWDSLRIAVTSIALSDLKNKIWKWTRPMFLSPVNQVHKNWVLFPEKIGGKFAILHSISPKIEIAYRNDLASVGTSEPYIESPQGARTKGRTSHWDNWVRGVGPAPIKTDKGWLVFYHATDREKHVHEYQIGAMVLDKNDPTRVIARSPAPVLSPDAHYETGGAKPGVVYATGATTKDDQLTLYYGASDNFVCAASTSLSGFMKRLLDHEQAILSPVIA